MIKDAFDSIAKDYDKQRKQLIPCFDDFYGMATAAALSKIENPTILDIGAGTGLFSAFLLKKYPKSNVTLIDLSENMLEKAKDRFKGLSNLNFIVGDYLKHDFNKQFDIIISALSIHHLSDQEKLQLFKKCFSLLKTGGIFINADQALGETPFLDSFYKEKWKNSIENSGLSKEELSACYERIKFDQEATLSQQLNWLQEAGFSDAGCSYKYYHFAVMVGRKSG